MAPGAWVSEDAEGLARSAPAETESCVVVEGSTTYRTGTAVTGADVAVAANSCAEGMSLAGEAWTLEGGCAGESSCGVFPHPMATASRPKHMQVIFIFMAMPPWKPQILD
jgi:hypothetical protein